MQEHKVMIYYKLFQVRGPNNKKAFSMGVQSIKLTKDGKYIIAGACNGVVALLNKDNLNVIRSVQFQSQEKHKIGINLNPSITSIEINKAQDHFFVGTNKSTIYLVAINDFDYELRHSAHYSRINDIAFPHNYSDLFITAGINDIRVWNMKNRNELLRINVPNLECLCVVISNDGKSIVSGWNDGKIRAFYPETGRLMYIINDCHAKGVTVCALSSDGTRLVTGTFVCL